LGQAAALAATRDVGYAWLFDHLEPAAPVARHPAIRHILFYKTFTSVRHRIASPPIQITMNLRKRYLNIILQAGIAACLPALASGQSIFKVVPTPNENFDSELFAASASSPTDIWAVGQSTIHFDGTKWTAFPAPMNPGNNTSALQGVADISPTEAWAVGGTNANSTTGVSQLIEHWDGTQWSLFPGPVFGSTDETYLYGLTAISANDIWAVGYSGLNFVTFSEHYDGAAWTLVSTPNVGSGPNSLGGVVALAPDNVWAVGYSTATQKPPPGQYDVPTKTLIEHYDGTSWSVVPSPNVGPNSQYQSNRLLGVTAVSPTDIWAFGSYFAASGSENQMTLLLHWDGTVWSLAASPSPEPGDFLDDILYSGVVTAPGSVWIVGSLDPAAQGKPVTDTFVLHTTGG